MAYGTVNADIVTTSTGQILGAGNSTAFKNRIINGGMAIDQRNAGASVTTSSLQNTVYTVDRWSYYNDVISKRTIQQSSVAPPGFKNSLKVTVIATDTSGPQQFIRQCIEGYNIADLNWGTANALPVVLSFWVRSSVTGQHGGAIQSVNTDWCFPFAYNINVADTWEYKTINISGPTTGTWGSTNGYGASIQFEHGVGYQKSPASAWIALNATSSTGSVNLCATNGATWYVTGVQLEVGTQATSFDFRDYGRELILCQRYYWTSNYANVQSAGGAWGAYYNTTTANAYAEFPVTMRSAPTVSLTAGNSSGYGNTWYVGGITANASLTVTRNNPSVSGVGLELGSSSPNGSLGFFIVFNGSLTASAEL